MDPLSMCAARCALFSDLTAADFERHVLPQLSAAEYAKGQSLIEPGDGVDRIGILTFGKVQIMSTFADGGYSLMDVLFPSEIVGADLAATRSTISPYYALAAEAVGVRYLPVRLLLSEGTLPESVRMPVLGRLLEHIAGENIRKYYRLAILSQSGLRDRILTYLTMQAKKRGTRTFRIPFSREDMAAFLAVNRSALSHELSRMRQEGLIDFHKNTFTLLPMGRSRSTWSE